MKKQDEKKTPAAQRKRPYSKPGFESSLAFERTSLGCGGQLNSALGPPQFCSMSS
jgi:hypothetical protein